MLATATRESADAFGAANLVPEVPSVVAGGHNLRLDHLVHRSIELLHPLPFEPSLRLRGGAAKRSICTITSCAEGGIGRTTTRTAAQYQRAAQWQHRQSGCDHRRQPPQGTPSPGDEACAASLVAAVFARLSQPAHRPTGEWIVVLDQHMAMKTYRMAAASVYT